MELAKAKARPMAEISVKWLKRCKECGSAADGLSGYEKGVIRFIQRTHPKIYAYVEDVSRSGMCRWINFFIIRDGNLERINFFIERLTNHGRDQKHGDAIKIHGCGMDMAFSICYDLSRSLFEGDRNGYQISDYSRI